MKLRQLKRRHVKRLRRRIVMRRAAVVLLACDEATGAVEQVKSWFAVIFKPATVESDDGGDGELVGYADIRESGHAHQA